MRSEEHKKEMHDWLLNHVSKNGIVDILNDLLIKAYEYGYEHGYEDSCADSDANRAYCEGAYDACTEIINELALKNLDTDEILDVIDTFSAKYEAQL